METVRNCKYAGCGGECECQIGPFPGGHYGKYVCKKCGRYNDWAKKPENEKNREAHQRELAKKYGKGYCEMCLRSSNDLRAADAFEGHHMIEYSDGGSADRSNIWVVCTACHRLIHWVRSYVGKNKPGEDPERVEAGFPVGDMESGPPW